MHRQRVRLVAQSPATPLHYRHPNIPSDFQSLERRYLHVFRIMARSRVGGSLGSLGWPRMTSAPCPPRRSGLGWGVRDWSKFSLVKTRAPGLALGGARIRGWSNFGQGVGWRPVVRTGVPPRDRSKEATNLEKTLEQMAGKLPVLSPLCTHRREQRAG